MILLLQTTDTWTTVFKQAGTVGVVCVFFGIIIYKVFIPMMRETVADARKERDRTTTLLERQASEFTDHIKSENENFRESLKDIVDRLEQPRNKSR